MRPQRLTLTTLFLGFLLLGFAAYAEPVEFQRAKLANGLDIIVIPHHRAPTVTHMLWYRIGGADEPAGQSGIAHLFEHLMFKATETRPAGAFSKIIAGMGGQDNAMTLADLTAYFQRIPKQYLSQVMAMEADRMVNLQLTKQDFDTERKVVLEERSMRVDQRPERRAHEVIMQQLYGDHPYAIPTIGWRREVETMPYAAARDFYKAYYAPDNALLLVVGDTTLDEVQALAEQHFGAIPASGASRPKRPKLRFGDQTAAAKDTLKFSDPQFQQYIWQRIYRVEPLTTDNRREVAALAIAIDLLGGDSNSLLYSDLIRQNAIVQTVSADLSYYQKDAGEVSLYATVDSKDALAVLDQAVDQTIARLVAGGFSDADVRRSARKLAASFLYEQDGQASMAFSFGLALAVGLDDRGILNWADDLQAVSRADVVRAINKNMIISQSISAHLGPDL